MKLKKNFFKILSNQKKFKILILLTSKSSFSSKSLTISSFPFSAAACNGVLLKSILF